MAYQTTDQDFVEDLIRRDREALAVLYDSYGSLCWSIFLRITGDKDSAECLFEELFLRIPGLARQYRQSDASFLVWLCGIARGMGIEFRQSCGTDCHPMHAKVRPALNGRQLLELAYFDGWSLRELARHCNTPLDTLTAKLRLAFTHHRPSRYR